ncbi:TrbI/VirB10 family protein [Sandaracinobacteroides saxicola]|uniref:TrbI/VirB10 family protein n=1 Tax=Sandaracinobacteroides saxicola TaxID=2759707 RepID=UPI001A9C8E9D|nr:TrbI/VirB10 family protein [Sandaracinobacteroides saxicola]
MRAGTIIPAALVTGIQSDLPGLVIAQVTEPVQDSFRYSKILIPQGARLIGTYDSELAAGQTRLLLVWTRLLLPDGRSIDLGRMPAADATGQPGLSDKVDNHWGRTAKAALISTILSIGAQSGTSGDESDIARALRDGASDSISRTGRQIVERELSRRPTITVRAGMPIRAILTRDLMLAP